MEPVNEQKRRASIAYILRRRKRSQKTGANSGGAVKSVNRKMRGHLTFTPTGSSLGRFRYLTLASTMIAIALPAICLAVLVSAASKNDETLAHARLDPTGWILVTIAGALGLGVVVFSVAYLVSLVWRFLKSLAPYKNE